ncbi:MAG: NUDIX hydrolase, partial [Clostridia bacterium]
TGAPAIAICNYITKHHGYPIKSWSCEFAAGIIDEAETSVEAAVREVKEETGFIVDEIKSLGEFYPSFGATDEVIHLFYILATFNYGNQIG